MCLMTVTDLSSTDTSEWGVLVTMGWKCCCKSWVEYPLSILCAQHRGARDRSHSLMISRLGCQAPHTPCYLLRWGLKISVLSWPFHNAFSGRLRGGVDIQALLVSLCLWDWGRVMVFSRVDCTRTVIFLEKFSVFLDFLFLVLWLQGRLWGICLIYI